MARGFSWAGGTTGQPPASTPSGSQPASKQPLCCRTFIPFVSSSWKTCRRHQQTKTGRMRGSQRDRTSASGQAAPPGAPGARRRPLPRAAGLPPARLLLASRPLPTPPRRWRGAPGPPTRRSGPLARATAGPAPTLQKWPPFSAAVCPSCTLPSADFLAISCIIALLRIANFWNVRLRGRGGEGRRASRVGLGSLAGGGGQAAGRQAAAAMPRLRPLPPAGRHGSAPVGQAVDQNLVEQVAHHPLEERHGCCCRRRAGVEWGV